MDAHLNGLSSFVAAFGDDSEGAAAAGGVRHVYDLGRGIKGYSGTFTEKTLEFIRRSPEVCIIACGFLLLLGGDLSGRHPSDSEAFCYSERERGILCMGSVGVYYSELLLGCSFHCER